MRSKVTLFVTLLVLSLPTFGFAETEVPKPLAEQAQAGQQPPLTLTPEQLEALVAQQNAMGGAQAAPTAPVKKSGKRAEKAGAKKKAGKFAKSGKAAGQKRASF